jgi:hypothetical protein
MAGMKRAARASYRPLWPATGAYDDQYRQAARSPVFRLADRDGSGTGTTRSVRTTPQGQNPH